MKKLGRYRVTFYSPLSVPDGMGGRVSGWHEEFTVWANVRRVPSRSSPDEAAGKRISLGRNCFIVRRSPDTIRVKMGWEIRHEGSNWAIAETTYSADSLLYLDIWAEEKESP